MSGPFHKLHRLYNRAKRIIELAQCFIQRRFLRGQLPEARFPFVKPIEVVGNVRGSISITMQDDSTFGVLATAKSSDLVIPPLSFFHGRWWLWLSVPCDDASPTPRTGRNIRAEVFFSLDLILQRDGNAASNIAKNFCRLHEGQLCFGKMQFMKGTAHAVDKSYFTATSSS